MKTAKLRTLSCPGLILVVMISVIQGQPRLELTVTDHKINLTSIEKTDKTAIKFSPGDTIRYEILARNSGTEPLTAPEITDPIPAGVMYIPGSAKGRNAIITCSIDGGGSYSIWPVKYEVYEDGKYVEKDATADMVTTIRWTLNEALPPQAQTVLSFMVIVK